MKSLWQCCMHVFPVDNRRLSPCSIRAEHHRVTPRKFLGGSHHTGRVHVPLADMALLCSSHVQVAFNAQRALLGSRV